MAIYQLSDELFFPPVSEAEPDGLIAIGGDLSADRLMLAYQSGIFPWFNEDEPIMWYSPNPRCVLFPDNIYVSRSMRQLLKKEEFNVTFNQDFDGVISHCRAVPRHGQDGTWITDEMYQAYLNLNQLGKAKSIEVWKGDDLVGGMYGIDLGHVFCGESMFSTVSNASKVALISFIHKFQEDGGKLFDCQVASSHVLSMGAEEIDREKFLNYMAG